MTRKTVGTVVIGTAIVAALIGWFAASQVRSPAEIAARTAAPEPSAILVPAEQRVLSTDIVTRGTGRFGALQQLTLTASALKADAGVIATVPLAGDQLSEGDVLLVASNRPVFLLAGDQPMFRDLGPGMSGDDVRQVEAALARLGFDPGELDGQYDALTEAAVTAWYEAAGFDAFRASESQLAEIRATERELIAARLDSTGAREALLVAEAQLAAAVAERDAVKNGTAGAGSAVTGAVAEAEAANRSAAAAVTARRLELETMLAGGVGTEAEIAAASAELDAAKANVEVVRLAGVAAIAEAQAVLNGATAAHLAAVSAAAAADQAGTAEVASKQAALDAVVADPTSTAEQLATAQADLAVAQAAQQTTLLDGQQSVADAAATLNAAPGALTAARDGATAADVAATAEVASKQVALDALTNGAPPTAAEIAAAEAEFEAARDHHASTWIAGQQAIADARQRETDAPRSLADAEAAVVTAEAAVANARNALGLRGSLASSVADDLGAMSRHAGVQLPADEVVFVPRAPVLVDVVNVARGDAAVDAVMTATDAVVAIDGSLALNEASLVTVGMRVQIDERDLGISATGTVQRVAVTPGTNGVDGFHVYFETLVDGAPPNLVGASVRLTVPVESTDGTVLAVPVSAVSLAADGSSRVQRERDGTMEFVTVRPGLAADGFVSVEPVDGQLDTGDLVVIGFEVAAVAGG